MGRARRAAEGGRSFVRIVVGADQPWSRNSGPRVTAAPQPCADRLELRWDSRGTDPEGNAPFSPGVSAAPDSSANAIRANRRHPAGVASRAADDSKMIRCGIDDRRRQRGAR